MNYTEEELLEALEILIEDYGFDEEEAIDLLVETLEDYADYDSIEILTENLLGDAIKGYTKRKIREKINKKTDNFKKGISDRKDNLKTVVNDGVRYKVKNMQVNSLNKKIEKNKDSTNYEHLNNLYKKRDNTHFDEVNHGANYTVAKNNLKNYARNDAKKYGKVAIAAGLVMAHKANKRRKFKKAVKRLIK